MMDAKYLAEIKEREQAATTGGWKAGGCPRRINQDVESVYIEIGSYDGQMDICRDATPADAAFIAHARTDIPALLAEVERLTVENGVLRSECRAHIQKQADLFKGYQQIKADNAAKDQQIATLKKALEIASSEVDVAFETLASHHVITWAHKVCNDQDNIDVWIQKAKHAQEQEGKK